MAPKASTTTVRLFKRLGMAGMSGAHRLILNPIRGRRNAKRAHRKLEIGPGRERIDGFETLNSITGRNVDYVSDAAGKLPFADGTFELVYASHIIEHIPWYAIEDVVREWGRILAPGGRLEIWTPDGLKICKAFVDAEECGGIEFQRAGAVRFNPEMDPCKWVSYWVHSDDYGAGELGHRNWHKAVISPRFLRRVMEDAGLEEIELLDRSAVRGTDHGWINLGMAGRKP